MGTFANQSQGSGDIYVHHVSFFKDFYGFLYLENHQQGRWYLANISD